MGSSSKEETASDGDTTSGGASPSNDGRLFAEGERVLAYHGPRVYGAKVQKAELRNKEWKYFVHYLGWNKNWDEWVSSDRLLKHSEENLVKQKALDKKQGVEKGTKSGRSAQTKTRSSADTKAEKDDTKNNAAKGKKRKHEAGNEVRLVKKKENVPAAKAIKIPIPATLKKQLVDEAEYITQNEKYLKLPRSPNVDEILTKYLELRIKKDGMITDSVGEILKGIRCYFDKSLPVMLLYSNERQQYIEAIVQDISPSTVYGAEHLLRLFVKLPELLSYVNMEEETWNCMQQTLLDFLKFIQKNQSNFLHSSSSAYDSDKVADGKGKGKDE